MALIDAVVRLIPGIMGNADLGIAESFAEGLLEDPHLQGRRSGRAGRSLRR